jgi:hypothetical protein
MTTAWGAMRQLFDHLVGEREELGRKLDAERLRGLEIDHQLELGRLLHRQLVRLGALEHLARHDAGLAHDVGDVGAVAQQTALGRELTQRPDNRYASLGSERRHPLHLRVIESIDRDYEDTDPALFKRGKRLFDLGLIARGEHFEPLPDAAGGGLRVLALGPAEGIGRVDQDADWSIVAQKLAHQLQPFGRERTGNAGDAGHVAARPA